MPTFDLEWALLGQGHSLVAGLDEAGRGPLAGPLVAAAVILPLGGICGPGASLPPWISLVDDSKALTPRQRERALAQVQTNSTAIGLGVVTSQEIDRWGIAEANRLAMLRAVDSLPVRPSCLLIDFVQLPGSGFPYHAVAHGDSLSYSVAAASIVAKVTRDRLMDQMDTLYPGYLFSRHKGYATPQHLRLLSLRGPCPIHRRSFAPLRALGQA